jgi:hypothetical protein
MNEPVQSTFPCGTPSSAQVHDVPLLDQLAVNSVDVVPLPGLIVAEHVGRAVPDTETVLDVHDLVPPGPVVVSVTE